ncbi:DUF192 domain-containing protein [Natrarchaeobaculum sulfurireducens]|uniref:DUF192 domain-containing protein n=1 Tax=Natrarchaeobaculum sulfurireducens TaxID=2044521 RepID=A0A346PUS4_9EURY|nr:DUF192 domain-containing protein [Natrarchaeobaculum sulfurireducens]AXR83269.1 hypothetical protein AArcMg_3285 [Natrarchaeobaculum sulfurireducens]
MAPNWSRRHLLGVVGTVAVAGCAGEDESTDSSDDPQSESGTETDAEGDGTADEEATDDEDDEYVYETAEVSVTTPDGDELSSVTAAIADTEELQYIGLSATTELPPDRGMLFVFDEVDDHTFVMREMDFGIDIIYADADGTITEIHHAPEPAPDEDGNEQEYPGRGQYVLEVVYEWAIDHDVSEGDVLEFDLDE